MSMSIPSTLKVLRRRRLSNQDITKVSVLELSNNPVLYTKADDWIVATLL